MTNNKKLKKFFLNIYKRIPKRFLVVGIINTIFGYFVSIFNLYYLKDFFNIILIAFINNFLAITFAFFLLKLFVFRTTNTNWFHEYLRSFIVYGFKSLVSILILWVSINLLNLNIFISQGLSMFLTLFLTYSGHKKFTFKL